jgi:hypothetical protein
VSVRVELDEVREQVGACRSCAYLMTVTDDGRPHAVAIDMVWEGDELVGGAGRRTVANAERSPQVSVLWPESGRDGYALIVDGTAEVRPDANSEGARVAVKPTTAVLHVTPAARGQGPGCVPVLGH